MRLEGEEIEKEATTTTMPSTINTSNINNHNHLLSPNSSPSSNHSKFFVANDKKSYKSWSRDPRLLVFLFVWAMLMTILNMSNMLFARKTVAVNDTSSLSSSLLKSVKALGGVITSANKNVEVPANLKCPYVWHGGSPTKTPAGSCWVSTCSDV